MRQVPLIGAVALCLLLIAGCSQSSPTAPQTEDEKVISLRNTSIGLEDDLGLNSADLGGDENPYGQGGNPDGWGEHDGELQWLVIEIEYVDPYFYTDEGYAGYYIGMPMCYRLHLTNIGERMYEDIDVRTTVEYYETHTVDRWWYPDEDGNTLITVEKGDPLPGDTQQTWWEVDFLPGETVVLEHCYTPTYETVSGLDQIHLELRHHNNGPWHAAKFYEEPEQGIFCPPPPQ